MHTFLSVTMAHMILLRLRVACEIIAFSSVTHTYNYTHIHTYIHIKYLRDAKRNYLPRAKALYNKTALKAQMTYSWHNPLEVSGCLQENSHAY